MSLPDKTIIIEKGIISNTNILPDEQLYIEFDDIVISVNKNINNQIYIEQTGIANYHIPVAVQNEQPLHGLQGLIVTPILIGNNEIVSSSNNNNISPSALLSLLNSLLNESNFTNAYNNKITTAITQIHNNKNALEIINTQINNYQNSINLLFSDVSQNTDNISDISNKLSILEVNINNNAANINSYISDINTNKTNITNIQQAIVTLTSKTDSIQTNEQTQNNNINNLLSSVTNIQSILNSLDNRINGNSSDITNLYEKLRLCISALGNNVYTIQQLQYEVHNLENTVSDNSTSISNIYSNYLNNWNTLENKVNSNTANIAPLTTRLATVEQDILDHGTSIFNIETTQEEHTTQLDTHSNTLINHDNRITNIEDRLDFDLFSFDKSEYGYVSNGDTIITQYEWSEQQPNIDVTLSQSVISVNGIDAEQELIFGIDGIKKSSSSDIYETTFNGAIVEYADPTNISLDWTSDTVTVSQPTNSENITTESDFTVTTADCMALNIKGKLAIKNTGSASFVSGILHLQAALDTPDGDDDVWFTIASLENLFKNNTSDWLEKNINVALVLNQASHKYKFRGKLISKYVPQNTCELSGYVYIDTVSESGTGTILSNKISAKYTIKE